MKKAKIFMYNQWAGTLVEDETGYHFIYEDDYFQKNDSEAVSLTLPLTQQTFHNDVLFPFFDGLIPEGWLLEIAEKNWKISARDRMSLLLNTCRDCVGAVSVISFENDEK